MINPISCIGWPGEEQVVIQPGLRPFWVLCRDAGKTRFFFLLLLGNRFWGSGGHGMSDFRCIGWHGEDHVVVQPGLSALWIWC